MANIFILLKIRSAILLYFSAYKGAELLNWSKTCYRISC